MKIDVLLLLIESCLVFVDHPVVVSIYVVDMTTVAKLLQLSCQVSTPSSLMAKQAPLKSDAKLSIAASKKS